jgi:hypothetical protein
MRPSTANIPQTPALKRGTPRDQHESPDANSGSSALESSTPTTPVSRIESRTNSIRSWDSQPSSIQALPPLQAKGSVTENDRLEPVLEDDPASFDLVSEMEGEPAKVYQLESRSDLMFSREHLQEIFKDPALLAQFTGFLYSNRPQSLPVLNYYLNALKALQAIKYANSVVTQSLGQIPGFGFSDVAARPTANTILEDKANQAFSSLVNDELPAFITYTFIQVVSVGIQRRIMGTLPLHLREASEGLAEVFCLTDPSRPDNPIVFASEGELL